MFACLLQEDEMRYVSIKGDSVPIKTMDLTNDLAFRVKITPWKVLASYDTKTEDFV